MAVSDTVTQIPDTAHYAVSGFIFASPSTPIEPHKDISI
nr:MAG TPA: hypothetical protein [Caudoviricetes sp.]